MIDEKVIKNKRNDYRERPANITDEISSVIEEHKKCEYKNRKNIGRTDDIGERERKTGELDKDGFLF